MNYTIGAEPAAMSRRTDHIFIASVLMLTGLGLVTLFSASYGYADSFFGDGTHLIVRQALFAAAGLALFLVVIYFDLNLLRKLIMPIVIGTLILCLLTFIPGIGVTKNGASRWIRVGSTTYQPSELVKLVLPLYLAHIFDKKQERIETFASGIFPQTIITILFFIIIFRQNNFSTAMFITLNALIIFFLAGVKIRYFIISSLIVIPLSTLLVLTREHRLKRIISFIWPDWDPLGAGFQVNSSLITIASGAFWGKGIGQGTRKVSSVPEVQSDFIFAAYAEEFGLIGIVLFFVIVFIFAARGYRAALRSDDTFRRLLASGLVTMVVSQILLNIGVVAGALPATGIPLPFFSAGGSSLITTLLISGIIVNISRNKRKQEAVHA